MNKIFYIILVSIVITSCSEYQKALKSDDVAVKYQTAIDMHEKGKYNKASALFEQLVPAMRGKPNAERFFYFFAKNYYELGNKMSPYYVTANYELEKFVSSYPKSEKREEAAFLAAKCMYLLSPKYTLDQHDTEKAIDKLQGFIDSYPKSEFLSEANQHVKELREKLELKAFENAKQYNTIAEWARDFRAPIKALDNFIADYPGTPYKEDALFYKYEALYKYALNSVENKKQERLLNAKAAYDALVKFNNESKFKKEADKMLETVEKELTQYSN